MLKLLRQRSIAVVVLCIILILVDDSRAASNHQNNDWLSNVQEQGPRITDVDDTLPDWYRFHLGYEASGRSEYEQEQPYHQQLARYPPIDHSVAAYPSSGHQTSIGGGPFYYPYQHNEEFHQPHQQADVSDALQSSHPSSSSSRPSRRPPRVPAGRSTRVGSSAYAVGHPQGNEERQVEEEEEEDLHDAQEQQPPSSTQYDRQAVLDPIELNAMEAEQGRVPRLVLESDESDLSFEEVYALVVKAWERKKMNIETMLPEELSKRVAEIKLEVGYPHGVGRAAGRIVRQHNPSSDYLHHYLHFNSVFANRITYLKKKVKDAPLLDTERKRARAVYLNFGHCHPPDYTKDLELKHTKQPEYLAEVREKISKVWSHFFENRIKEANPFIRANQLTVNDIEIHSRNYICPPLKASGTMRYLKLYMGLKLHFTNKQINQFTLQRRHWRTMMAQEREMLRRQMRRGEYQAGSSSSSRRGKEGSSTEENDYDEDEWNNDEDDEEEEDEEDEEEENG